MFFSAVTNPATRFVNNLVYLVVAVVGAYISIDTAGAFSVGMLLTFLLYANKYTKPFNEISGVVTELQSAFAAANRVLEVVEQPAEEPDEPGALSFTPKGAVEIDGISFPTARIPSSSRTLRSPCPRAAAWRSWERRGAERPRLSIFSCAFTT